MLLVCICHIISAIFFTPRPISILNGHQRHTTLHLFSLITFFREKILWRLNKIFAFDMVLEMTEVKVGITLFSKSKSEHRPDVIGYNLSALLLMITILRCFDAARRDHSTEFSYDLQTQHEPAAIYKRASVGVTWDQMPGPIIPIAGLISVNSAVEFGRGEPVAPLPLTTDESCQFMHGQARIKLQPLQYMRRSDFDGWEWRWQAGRYVQRARTQAWRNWTCGRAASMPACSLPCMVGVGLHEGRRRSCRAMSMSYGRTLINNHEQDAWPPKSQLRSEML